MYKALITDIDGTIVASRSIGTELDDATIEVVQKAQERGAKITCATGRGWSSTEPVVKRLRLESPCIIEGGSRIVDSRSGETLWEKELSEEDSKKVLEIFKKLSSGKEYLKSTSNEERVLIGEAGEMSGTNRIIYLLGTDGGTADSVVAAVDATGFAVAYKTTPSWAGPELFDVHVTDPHGTKKNAIDEWQKMVGVNDAETAGMGDSENDMPLFESVGFRVAVGNATESLKKLADWVAPSLNEGALRVVVEKYLMDG